jgi:repressor of nif and glnA expression
MCSADGTLLKAGIPMDSRFGGILQIRNHEPFHFGEISIPEAKKYLKEKGIPVKID